MKKSYLTIFLIILLAILSILWYYQNNKQVTIAPSNEQTSSEDAYLIKFSFDNQDTISVEYPYTFSPDQNLLEVTADIANQNNWTFDFQNYGDMGVLVTQIKDKINGQNQKYWQYFIEDKQPLMSVDRYYPKFGEIIEWKFQVSEF